MLLLVFSVAALLSYLACRMAPAYRNSLGIRPEGVGFLLAAGLAGLGGLVYFYWPGSSALGDLPELTAEARSAMPVISPQFLSALAICVVVAGVYVLSGIRGVGGFPVWVADLVVLGAAVAVIRYEPRVLLQSFSSFRSDSGAQIVGPLAWALTLLWIWSTARLSAALDRTPAVAGGYLGLVALTVLVLMGPPNRVSNYFAWTTCAAIAGAGLATFLASLFNPKFHLGWSSILAAGFALGTASCLELSSKTLPGILTLGVLSLGLPLLDVTFFSMRATLRGQKVDWTTQRMRLHQALQHRGVSQAKISLLYFGLGTWLCILCYLATRWLFTPPIRPVLALAALFLIAVLFAMGVLVFVSLARILMRRRSDEQVPESLEAFGVKISPVSMDEALDKIEEFIQSGKPHHVVTTDANSILTSRQDEEYAAIMRRAALITPDGFGVVWGARLLNLPIYERVTGVDMVTGICERAAKKGYRIYILGSSPGVASTAAANLTKKYPGLQVVGTHHGFWRRDYKEQGLSVEEADARMAEEVSRARPDVLFVAMGIPSQEKFIAAQMERLQVPVSLGVGGSFDVYSGKFNRAPLYIQRMGMEWLYRVWIDPSRWKRMGYVPRFVVVAIQNWLASGTGRHGTTAG